MTTDAHILEVKKFGNPVLRNDSTEVTKITLEHHQLVKDMIDTMYDEKGIGLAAPQIGQNIRMFVIDTNFDKEAVYETAGEIALSPKMPFAIFNPKITKTYGDDFAYEEGCLSVPEINADVIRPERIQLQGMTLDGETFDLECGGLLARCAQHEIDHLDGVLFVDRINPNDQKRISSKLKKLQQKTEKKLRKKR